MVSVLDSADVSGVRRSRRAFSPFSEVVAEFMVRCRGMIGEESVLLFYSRQHECAPPITPLGRLSNS
jgi:hypothetical protein